MKRKNKNIIAIILILVLLCSMIVTLLYAKNNTVGNAFEPMNMGEFKDSDTSPEIPSNDDKNNMETPPDKPREDNFEDNNFAKGEILNDDKGNTETPPEKPNGDMNNNMPGDVRPDMKENSNTVYLIFFGVEALLFSLLVVYLVLSLFNKKTFKETFSSVAKTIIYILGVVVITGGLTLGLNYLSSTSTDKLPNNMNNKETSVTYSSSHEIMESTISEGDEYTSNSPDENALLVKGNIDVTLSDSKFSKTGDSDGGDATSFYGINSAIIAKDGATLTLKDINVTTDAVGANGVFSYGGSATTNNTTSDGTTINISDSIITTTKDNSGGIMTTGGGIMNANNLTVTTAGISSAAIRTDRGGGTVIVNGGTYTTTNQGSPTIYSTADITVKNAELNASASEGVVIEGKNKVTLENVTLTDNNTKLNGQSTTYKNIFLYQSMSGDANIGVSEFSAKDSTIITNNGDTLYVTNTSAKITLENNEIINNDASGNFLRIKEDSWGNSGSNGGIVTLSMIKQEVTGNIVVDAISTLDMTLEDNSYYEGSINVDNSAKSINLTLDKASKIKLTGDSYVSSLTDEDVSYANIDFNGYKLYVNGQAIN